MAAPETPEEKFSLQEALDSFKLCLSENKEIDLEHYVAGWRALVKLVHSLGDEFAFISKDADNKIHILVTHLEGENRADYVTIQSMVKYELENKLVDLTMSGHHAESGCQALLRLHRALKWLQLVMERLCTSNEDSETSVMCTEAYDESLSEHNLRWVRTAACEAFRRLPDRLTFFDMMNSGTVEQVVAVIREALPFLSEVHQITEELYAQHNLLNLP